MKVFALQTLVFLSSFLVFLIELIMGKIILPSFGGGYLVWGISVVLYQGLLFLGYYYVHLMNHRFSFSRFRMLQIVLLALSCLSFPIALERLQNPAYNWPPVVEIVILLTQSIGPVFFMLASLSIYTQIQLSHSDLEERKNPYVLFAGSNLGAFAALLSYPFLIEPLLDTPAQLKIWQVSYVILVMLFLVLQKVIPVFISESEETVSNSPTPKLTILCWLLLSSAPSALFLAVTNQLTFNIAPIPLLWVLPLALYLLTFVLAFKKKPFCPKWLQDRFSLFVGMGVALYLLHLMGSSVMEFLVMIMLRFQLPLYALGTLMEPLLWLGLCFAFCLVCHFRLHAEKPEAPGQLTTFYLCLSIGGFLGGALINWVVPLIFDSMVESLLAFLPGALAFYLLEKQHRKWDVPTLGLAGGLIALVLIWPWILQNQNPVNAKLLNILFAILVFLGIAFIRSRHHGHVLVLSALILLIPLIETLKEKREEVYQTRNYYGIYSVYDRGPFRYMKHGTVVHGAQNLAPDKAKQALMYYHPRSPMGEFFRFQHIPNTRTALVGLGTGSLAVLSRPGDEMTYFELDPEVGHIARNYFAYLKQARGKVNLVYGDARVSLRKEPSQSFDTLVVDVFNSGSIPVHLLTVEAIQEYQRLLIPGGLMFFHISNEHLNLAPVIQANARQLGLHSAIKHSPFIHSPEGVFTLWAALTADEEKYRWLTQSLKWRPIRARPMPPWTDRHSSILSVLVD